MAEPHEDISKWLRSQPDWLQNAAEMVLKSWSISDEQIGALIALLKTLKRQLASGKRNFDGLAPTPSPTSEVRLERIGEIAGIENLEPRTPLEFGNGNLCVIYGHNGSGKSGYTRLLKKACGKPRAAELKPNVFKQPPPERKCTFHYCLSDATKEVEWQANSAPVEDLRHVDIFDADGAKSYLTEETAATYTPPSVTLFEELATICDRVKSRLQSEQDLLVKALPELPTEYVGSDVGKVYLNLKPNADDPAIKAILKWTDEDAANLEQLASRLKDDDPTALAKEKRQKKAQLDQIIELLKQAASLFGEENVTAIRQFRVEALAKRKIAAEAGHLDSAKLEGVGTETWQAMWEAARVYSQTPYPNKEYPVTDDARCVLCHQELDSDTQVRLNDFEKFVQGTLVADAEAAQSTHSNAIQSLPSTPTDEQIATQCQAAGLTEERWSEALKAFWAQAEKCRDALLNGEATEPASTIVTPTDIIEGLSKRSEQLATEAEQHDKDAADFDRDKATKEKVELEARQWTSQQSKAILAEVERLKLVGEYESWKRAANSGPVSLKAGKVAKSILTPAFVGRFNAELKKLGASRICVEPVPTRTERGRPLHRLQLKGAQTGFDLPDSVLSEGERRVVSLAAFLADVADKPHAVPFVFDDPISSLDHEFEWNVALRLCQLAQTRQVLVFTHRLSLYGAMEDAAKKIGEQWKDQHLQQSCIESFGGAAGHPADQATWNANTKKANNILLGRLVEAKKAGEKDGAEAYRSLAQGICSDFRKLLERTVEEDLLNAVVKRHRRSITTDNRLNALPRITHDDCTFIDELMTSYSCFEHSQSTETPVVIPEEPYLRADIEALKSWREEFKKR